MQADAPTPVPASSEDEVFEFGDQTIFRMWQQPFAPAGKAIDPDETMMLRPPKAVAAVVTEVESHEVRSETSPPEFVESAATPVSAATSDPDGDEFGTMVVRPHSAHQPSADDRMARLEAKVDALALAVDEVRKALDSIREALQRSL